MMTQRTGVSADLTCFIYLTTGYLAAVKKKKKKTGYLASILKIMQSNTCYMYELAGKYWDIDEITKNLEESRRIES